VKRASRPLIAGLLLSAGLAAVLPGLSPAAGGTGSRTRLRGIPFSGKPNTLHVIPFPGTPDASPESQIIFSSLTPSDLRSVSVSGSASGAHAGQMLALPDNAGTAFAPDRPFTPGEHVRVTARLTSPAAGTASGDPGATTLIFSFSVAIPASGARTASATDGPGRPSRHGRQASGAMAPGMRFHSQVFHPAAVSVTGNAHTSREIFVTPYAYYPRGVPFQRGPEIVNGHGHLVWFRNLGRKTANNLEVQSYQGQPVLTWWQGQHQNGVDVIMDRSYRTVAIVHAGDGYLADTHEFQITPQGTALLDAVVPVKVDLTGEGGSRYGTLHDCVIQEVDIKTGHVLWEWHALGHVPLSDSYIKPADNRPFDFFHLNSIQQLPGGNLLISARHTWAVYEISKRTGNILWELGGKHSSFRVGRGARFEWQHDARLIDHNLLSVFDDASNGPVSNERESSGKVLTLNYSARTATLRHRYDHSPPTLSASQGNVQTLPNYDRFVGWGSAPEFSEFTPEGRQIFSGDFALGVQSYRAFLFRWRGRPTAPPAEADLAGPGGTVTVYASWNGATQVVAWRVLGGPSPNSLSVLDPRSPKRGFETAIRLHRKPSYFVVQALNQKGNVIGTSAAHRDHANAARRRVSR
jgi:hypothetical protein